jgi:multidrug efflux pump subunit AcrA (membrane-fusion protein)
MSKAVTRHLTWIFPLLALVAAVSIFMALKASKPQAPSRPVVEKTWSVQAKPVTFANFRPEIILYGQIESPQTAQLSSSVTAYVEQVLAREGQHVSKGALLIQLDPRDAQLILRQRKSDLKNSEAKINAARIQHEANKNALNIEKQLYALASKSVTRYKDLSARKVGSEDQLDTARKNFQLQALSLNSREQAISTFPAQLAQLEAEQEKATALRDSALLELQRTTITAPFTARIASVSAAVGDRIKTGDPLITLYNPSLLQVRSQVPSKMLPLIRQGLNEETGLNAIGLIDKKSVALHLSRLASTVTNGKTGVDALFEFASDQFTPEPGRTLSLTLSLPYIDNLIAITPLALYGTDRVYRIIEGKLESVIINKVGDTHNSNGQPQVLIQSSELKSGELLIITQLPNAITGLPVKVME